MLSSKHNLHSDNDKFQIDFINFKDVLIIEEIGKQSLPIYYKSSEILFLLFDKDYLLYKIYSDLKIVGFVIAKKKYHEFDKNDDNHLKNDYSSYSTVVRFHIMSIAIDPEYRKRGLASKLIDKIKDHINTNFKYKVKISLFVLTNNIAAIKLYEKNYFKQIFEDENYYESLPHKNAFYYET